MAAEPVELVGVLEQRERAVADQVRGRLVPGGEQQQAHRDDLVGLQRHAAVGGMDQRAQQVLARIPAPLGDDRDEKQHHRHRRRADRLDLRGRRVELEHARQRGGLAAQQFRALEADVEQLGDHRQRDRVGELAHQLDRLAFDQWRECGSQRSRRRAHGSAAPPGG